MSGILSGPVDGPRKPSASYRRQPAERGLLVRHRTTGTVGRVTRFTDRWVTIIDRAGREHSLPVADGAFSVDGSTVNLVRPAPAPRAPTITASGSIAPERRGARVARASRILVEGLHDADLVEKVWGDDLRAEGVVVEPLHGADDLGAVVADFDPGPGRRLGILLDHLIDGTKEHRLAAAVDDDHVLITGHPFVDVWQAIRPERIGLEAWPTIDRTVDWKTGICAHLGFTGTPGELWPRLLGRIRDYRDLEAELVGAVEQLIDFVAPPPAE